MLPQQFMKRFKAVEGLTSIDDPRLLTWADSSHQTWSKDFNNDWQEWFKSVEGTDMDSDKILTQAEILAKKYGLVLLPHFKKNH